MTQAPADMSGLPHRMDDPLLRLYFQYFDIAELMHEKFKTLEGELPLLRARVRERPDLKGRRKRLREKRIECAHYMKLWLACLYVSIEGLYDLNTYINEKVVHSVQLTETQEKYHLVLQYAQVEYINVLKRFRNGIFHYQRTPEKLVQFFDPDDRRFDWAEVLHRSLADFFSRYRVERLVLRVVLDGIVDDGFLGEEEDIVSSS